MIDNYVAGGAVNINTNVKRITTYVDTGGHEWRTTDPTNRSTTYRSNALGQVTQVTDAALLTTVAGFDGHGTQRWTRSPANVYAVTMVLYVSPKLKRNTGISQRILIEMRCDIPVHAKE